MPNVDLITAVHTGTKRDYLGRVNGLDKAVAAEAAVKFGHEYWDGDRSTGYGGYRYDGRWRAVAERMAQLYGLRAGSKVLDVGCGKGFLLHDLTQVVPGIEVTGIDISDYAIANAKPEVKPFLQVGNARELPFADGQFDFVYSITTLHNLYLHDLWAALGEIARVSTGGRSHITVEAYRNEREKVNLMYWQLTCRAFHTPQEWEWLFAKAGYTGDYGYIYFE